MATKRRAPAPAPLTACKAGFPSAAAAISEGNFGRANVATRERRIKARRFIGMEALRRNQVATGFFGGKHGRERQNIQHSTPNVQHPMGQARAGSGFSSLDVGYSKPGGFWNSWRPLRPWREPLPRSSPARSLPKAANVPQQTIPLFQTMIFIGRI